MQNFSKSHKNFVMQPSFDYFISSYQLLAWTASQPIAASHYWFSSTWSFLNRSKFFSWWFLSFLLLAVLPVPFFDLVAFLPPHILVFIGLVKSIHLLIGVVVGFLLKLILCESLDVASAILVKIFSFPLFLRTWLTSKLSTPLAFSNDDRE